MGAGTRQSSRVVKGVLFTPQFLPVFFHLMGTLRTSTVVVLLIAALLAAGIAFCLVCLVCGLCCCSFCFWSVCFPFVLPYVVKLSCFSSCSCLRGKEG